VNAHDQAAIEAHPDGTWEVVCACGDRFTGQTSEAAQARHRVHHGKANAIDGIALARAALNEGRDV
jgi:hypothetical protein